MNTPINPTFTIIKVGCKGVYITRTSYPDVLENGMVILLEGHKPIQCALIKFYSDGILSSFRKHAQ